MKMTTLDSCAILLLCGKCTQHIALKQIIYSFKLKRGHHRFNSREDKGDREGIPHTHPIPQVIRLDLFLRP